VIHNGLADEEADTARWKAVLNDPEFMDALMLGVPKRPDGWWRQQPGEDAIAYMFRIFPLARLN
jgi:hypothetical protein